MATVLFNGRFLIDSAPKGGDSNFAECLVIDQKTGKIVHVGSTNDDAVRSADESAHRFDMQNRIVLPGFIDSHMHLLMMGQSLEKLDLNLSTDLEHIRSEISKFAKAHSDRPRLLCRNWRNSSVKPLGLASQIDDLDTRPIYIEADDLHSCWCNTAALTEMDAGNHKDPTNGKIHRGTDGKPSGLLSEGAVVELVWPFLAQASSTEEKLDHIQTALNAYIAAGYTGMIEMAMDDSMWELIQTYRKQHGPLPIWLAAHYLVSPATTVKESLQQVDRAIELKREYNRESHSDCWITGIKLICDGVVDACTAALKNPYHHSGDNAEPMWTVEQLVPVLKNAGAARLQCALHAIGDKAIKIAIDALEQVGNPAGRHRIEHLETCSPEDALRLGKLGITASVQAVHLDPAGLTAWPTLLGAERCKHVFPYSTFADNGPIALGTDAPTAPHFPMPNMYIASTRKSAREPDSPDQTTPQFALTLGASVNAATQGAAYSCFAETWTGRLQAGFEANLVAIDMEWDASKLLRAKVVETWSRGKRLFSAR